MSTMKFCREWFVPLLLLLSCNLGGVGVWICEEVDSNLMKLKSLLTRCNLSNNILYPKEERDRRALLFACRNCEHQEISDNNCVYRNEVHHSAGERTQVLQDVASDPTLPRTKTVRCAECGHGEAVFFQATARGEEGMTLFFVCCSPDCGHRWRE